MRRVKVSDMSEKSERGRDAGLFGSFLGGSWHKDAPQSLGYIFLDNVGINFELRIETQNRDSNIVDTGHRGVRISGRKESYSSPPALTKTLTDKVNDMAINNLSTQSGVINAARRSSQSSHDAFASFLATLPALISSEADVTGYSGQDPALDHWIREAEAARQTSLDQVDYLHSELGANATGHERLFFEIAAAFQTIMTSDDIEDVAALRTQARVLCGCLNEELQALTMSAAALDRLECYLALDDAFEELEPGLTF